MSNQGLILNLFCSKFSIVEKYGSGEQCGPQTYDCWFGFCFVFVFRELVHDYTVIISGKIFCSYNDEGNKNPQSRYLLLEDIIVTFVICQSTSSPLTKASLHLQHDDVSIPPGTARNGRQSSRKFPPGPKHTRSVEQNCS